MLGAPANSTEVTPQAPAYGNPLKGGIAPRPRHPRALAQVFTRIRRPPAYGRGQPATLRRPESG
jgi:hypothetical protein